MSSIEWRPTSRRLTDNRGKPGNLVGEIWSGPGAPATEDRLTGARRHFAEIKWSDLGSDGGHLYDRATGVVWVVAPGDPLHAKDPSSTAVELFTVRSDNTLVFLKKPQKAPFNITDLAQAAVERERLEAEQEREHARRLDRQPRSEITLADLQGRELPTIRRAAQLLVGDLRGSIKERHGRLVFAVPELLVRSGSWGAAEQQKELRRQASDAAAVLVAAREVVLEELARGKQLDPERLPDVQAGADGGAVAA